MKQLSIITALLLPVFAFAAPHKPIDLTLQALSGEAVKINWNNVNDSIFDGPTGYKIYRNGEFLTATRQICYTSDYTSKVCSFTDHNLKPNTEYSYTIVASDDKHFTNNSKYILSSDKDFNYFAASADKKKAYGKHIIDSGGDGWYDYANIAIKITDISTPNNPVDTGFSYESIPYTYKSGNNKGKTVKGNVQSAILSKDGSKVFVIVDYGLENDTSNLCDFCEDAYFINYLTVLDSSDLSVLSQSEFHERLSILGTSSDGKKLYVESRRHTLKNSISKKVIDVSNASNPTIAETQDFPNLVTSGNEKLYTIKRHPSKFSILDETSKAELGSILKIEHYYKNLILSSDKNTLYAVGSSYPNGGFLQLIDIKNSNKPKIISIIDTPNSANNVVISADSKKAYIGHRDGIEIVDISNPYSPKVIHRVFIDHGVDKMILIDNSKIIASSDSIVGGMYVIDISSF